jgi:amidohydrolase
VKASAQQTIASHTDALLALSHQLHADPETAFEEHRSAALVADLLEQNGFVVERGVADLPTAFVARFGSGELNIGICAEYDALPGVGHACGHNIIAAAAVGAALALAPLAGELGITVTVLGTPAEEGGGGKVYMLRKGVFDGLHASMMVHPGMVERDAMSSLAISRFTINYTGKAAHAAAAPERGINAASAMALAQLGVGMMREHLLSSDRVHGYVSHGGEAMNVIPESAGGVWATRATTLDRMTEVKRRTYDVFKGAAVMTGTELEITTDTPVFAEIKTDADMAALWRANVAALGRESLPVQPDDGAASTDMGNVSYAMPSIHPLIAIESNGANIHEMEFAHHAAQPTGDKALVDGAVAMAWTAIDMATSELRARLLQRAYAVANEDPTAAYLSMDGPTSFTYKPE